MGNEADLFSPPKSIADSDGLPVKEVVSLPQNYCRVLLGPEGSAFWFFILQPEKWGALFGYAVERNYIRMDAFNFVREDDRRWESCDWIRLN